MPGGFPITPRWSLPTTIGAQTGSSLGTNITANASANVYGSWTELTPGTPAAFNWAFVFVQSASVAAATFAVDVGLGASGSEVAVLSALQFAGGVGGQGVAIYQLPFPVPASQRVTARCQCNVAAAPTIAVSLLLFNGDFADLTAPGPVDTLGWSSTTTLGVTVDTSGGANTKGPYVELVTSTPADYRGFVLGFDYAGLIAATEIFWLYDLALGASGSEVVVLSNFILAKEATGIACRALPPIWFPIPAGQRVAVRAQSNNTNATTRKFGVTFYGIR